MMHTIRLYASNARRCVFNVDRITIPYKACRALVDVLMLC